MRSAAAVMAAVVLGAGARCAGAATLSVTITGAAETEYQLDVAGIVKSGRLGSAPGAATVRDLVDIGGRDTVVARLSFISADGSVVSCRAVTVKLTGSLAACDPAFTQTDRQAGVEAFTCESRCEPRKRAEKSSDEDEDDDDWVYALGRPARPAPRLDGWAQSYYSGSMPPARGAGLY